jgi:hypothetical protein
MITDIQPLIFDALIREEGQDDGIRHRWDPQRFTFIAGRISTNIGRVEVKAHGVGRVRVFTAAR